MNRYIALLRGINVGGRNIKMADLKQCFDSLDFSEVSTVLNTGNVVFSSNQKDARRVRSLIESGLQKAFDYPAKVQVLRYEALQGIIDANPFDTQGGSCHNYVIFLDDGLEAELIADAGKLDDGQEAAKAGQGVVYWRVLKGNTLSSSLASWLTKAKYKQFNTNRNINTLQKLLK